MQLSVLLVGESLDRGGVNNSLFVFQRRGNRILSNSGLSGGGMRRNQYTLAALDTLYGSVLEFIQGELVLLGLDYGPREGGSHVCGRCDKLESAVLRLDALDLEIVWVIPDVLVLAAGFDRV